MRPGLRLGGGRGQSGGGLFPALCMAAAMRSAGCASAARGAVRRMGSRRGFGGEARQARAQHMPADGCDPRALARGEADA